MKRNQSLRQREIRKHGALRSGARCPLLSRIDSGGVTPQQISYMNHSLDFRIKDMDLRSLASLAGLPLPVGRLFWGKDSEAIPEA